MQCIDQIQQLQSDYTDLKAAIVLLLTVFIIAGIAKLILEA